MKSGRDYYRVLHVQRDAPAEVIRSSYRTMMQKLKMHPDLGGDHEDAALINAAFAVLSDPDARAEYDATLNIDRDPGPASTDSTGDHPDQATGPDEAGVDAGTPQGPGNNKETRTGSAKVPDSERCVFCAARCRPVPSRAPDDVCGSCGSPLYPAQQRRFEADSQRAIERIPKRMSASFAIHAGDRATHAGSVQDISLNGMQLRTATELAVGQLICVKTAVLDAVASVVDSRRLSPGGALPWRVGLVFLTMKIHLARGSFVSVDA
jgi:hypothetical protein